MQLYNTANKRITSLAAKPHVSMYICGITPYDSAHLGHIFTFLTYDLLTRRLHDTGTQTTTVRNITDVDDPLYAKAIELGVPYTDIAMRETESFQTVMNQLNMIPMDHEPLASDYINDMADAVQQLLDSHHAYYVGKDIYFDTKKARNYGTFSAYTKDLQHALLNDRGGNTSLADKRNQLDFLLWKHVDDAHDPAKWTTTLGTGRPGWHIECSVMSSKLLGSSFDIHGGGSDLVFPHHESEIAQAEALNGTQPADIWLHTAPITMAGEKMSKSLGNMIFAKDLLKSYDSSTIRLALMQYHHRVGGEWHNDILDQSRALLNTLRDRLIYTSEEDLTSFTDTIRSALDDDINTPHVIDALTQFILVNQPHREPTNVDLNHLERLLGITLS